jgi:hypothetical protein
MRHFAAQQNSVSATMCEVNRMSFLDEKKNRLFHKGIEESIHYLLRESIRIMSTRSILTFIALFNHWNTCPQKAMLIPSNLPL